MPQIPFKDDDTVPESSTTPDVLLSESFIAGRRAGLAGLPIALAEGEPDSQEHAQWILGWRSGTSQRAYEDAMKATA